MTATDTPARTRAGLLARFASFVAERKVVAEARGKLVPARAARETAGV